MALQKKVNPIMDFIKSVKSEDSFTLEEGKLRTFKIDTGVLVLNGLLGGDFFDGGLEGGRTTEFAGESASGKSALARYCIGKFFQQFEDTGVCIIYETEGRESENLAQMIPAEYKSRVIVEPIATIDELNKKMLGDLKTKLEEAKANKQEIQVMCVLDSLGNLASDKEIVDAAKGQNSKQDFTRPKQLKKFFRTIPITLLSKFNIPFVTINHTYATVGSFIVYQKASGGSGREFLSNTIIQVTKKSQDDEAKNIKKKTAIGLKILKSSNLVPKTAFTVYLQNGKFLKYSSILSTAEEYKIVKEVLPEGIKERVAEYKKQEKKKLITKEECKKIVAELKKDKGYLFEEKIYSLSQLKTDTETMDKIARKVNEVWKKENSFIMAVDETLNESEEDEYIENDSDSELNTEVEGSEETLDED